MQKLTKEERHEKINAFLLAKAHKDARRARQQVHAGKRGFLNRSPRTMDEPSDGELAERDDFDALQDYVG